MKRTVFIKIIAFLAILVYVASCGLSGIRNRNTHIEEYINDLTNADVLILGSSHAYVNLNGATMWNERGIASACLAQPSQPFNMTYYTLKSALKYNKPKLVVVDLMMVLAGDEDYNKPYFYATALLEWPILRNLDCRIEASSFLAEEEKLEYILGFPVWHEDYRAVTYPVKETCTAGYEYMFGWNANGQEETRASSDTVEDRAELNEYAVEYLQKIIDLCKKEGIELLFVKTPFQAQDHQIAHFNTAMDMAAQNGIRAIDMNSYVGDIGIDLSNEMYDWGHASVTGSEKNSVWLARYISEHYDIPDRRGDFSYSNWDKVSENYYIAKQEYLQRTDIRLDEYIRAVFCGDTFEKIVWINDEAGIYEDKRIMEFLADIVNAENVIEVNGGKIFCDDESSENAVSAMQNKIEEQINVGDESDLTIVVLEKETGRVIDATLFNMNGIMWDAK